MLIDIFGVMLVSIKHYFNKMYDTDHVCTKAPRFSLMSNLIY